MTGLFFMDPSGLGQMTRKVGHGRDLFSLSLKVPSDVYRPRIPTTIEI